MTNMQQTSLYAYAKLKEFDELNKREQEVYTIFKQCGNMTNKQVSIRLGLEINQITGRTNSLVSYGYLEKKGAVMQTNKRPAILWGVLK